MAACAGTDGAAILVDSQKSRGPGTSLALPSLPGRRPLQQPRKPMMSRALLARALTIFVGAVSLLAMSPPVGAQGVALDGTMPQPLPLFPADNWWNVDVSQAPLDPSSAAFIAFIGTTRQLHPDWGGSAGDPDDPTAIYGIPYIVVPGSQPLVPVTFV